MSLSGNIGAQAAAEEILEYLEQLRELPNFDVMSPDVLFTMLEMKAREIQSAAKARWY